MREKTTLQIIRTTEYAHHPEKASKVLHESDLYSLADATPDEIREYGLFLVGEKINIKDLEK